ncbi:MAG: class I SAM-dependent methyltransferase [Candidatus Hodarchaeota archaeon]
MKESHHNHDWSGERAESFIKMVEKRVNFRYKPFAKQVVKTIKIYNMTKNCKILDIGCGPGLLLFEIKKLNPNLQLIGVDPSEVMLNSARTRAKEYGFNDSEFKKGYAEGIPIIDNEIDIVVCFNSLHDFKSPKEAIKEVSRILRKNGIFILKDKNGSYPKWKIRLHFVSLSFKLGKDQAKRHYKSKDHWLKLDQVKDWMSENGLKVRIVRKKADYVIIGKK